MLTYGSMTLKVRGGVARRMLLVSIAACVGLSACGDAVDDPATAAIAAESTPLVAQARDLKITVVAPVRPVTTTDERRHLLHELVLENTGASPARVLRVDVTDARRGALVARFEGDALAAIFESTDPQAPAGTVPVGGLAAVYIDTVLPKAGETPRRFEQTLTIETNGSTSVVRGPSVPVLDVPPARLSPPLRGHDFIALNGCCDGNHRRALLFLDGAYVLSQRYAIDFIRLDLRAAEAGEDPTLRGDPTKNESYFIYGDPVLAAGPGRIVEVRDGVPDNVPTAPLPPATVESAPGNFVVQSLGDGRFALYAHFKTGSIRVKTGDVVPRGAVIGLVGNSGNSTGPHLHFHVMDRPSPLASNGLPYVFDRFRFEASVDLTVDGAPLTETPPPKRRADRLPMDGDIVTFP
jgi:hypothetical protein